MANLPNKTLSTTPKMIPRKGWKKHNERKEYVKFYNSTAWRKTSKIMLLRHPLCNMCEKRGKLVDAKVTDHINPISQGGEKYDYSNLQTLCHSCHNRKSQSERKKNVN